MECRILVAGEADESDLSFFFGSIKCFEDATVGVGQLGVIIVDDAVDLLQVQMIRLIPSQRVFEHLHC